jgi:hypothetical protein
LADIEPPALTNSFYAHCVMTNAIRAVLKKLKPLGVLLVLAAFAPCAPAHVLAEEQAAKLEPSESETLFLDRLMMAESGGRLTAKNPNSSALGPFQFIESTFFEVVSRHLPDIAEDKSYAEIQQLRIDLDVARRAALAYTRENAAYLSENGIAPQAGHLRLAFLLGPSGAKAVISAEPDTPLTDLLSGAAIAANPFMADMTAKQLIERTGREAAGLNPLPLTAVAASAAARPQIKVRCNLKLASCRKWLALAKMRIGRKGRAR